MRARRTGARWSRDPPGAAADAPTPRPAHGRPGPARRCAHGGRPLPPWKGRREGKGCASRWSLAHRRGRRSRERGAPAAAQRKLGTEAPGERAGPGVGAGEVGAGSRPGKRLPPPPTALAP